ncbi:MAG: ATP-grasp domain-containing protein [Candidatus Omnitrophica bacterium]|nr:ATP-grasp domain-containing protein [Candidatus Omnitrophota bacterium]
MKVLLTFDTPSSFSGGHDFQKEFEDPDWVTEKDVYKALLKNGHEVSLLGIHKDITILIEEIKVNRPDVVFNLIETFRDKVHLDKNVAWLLEMLQVPYTGAPPTSLLICNNKALSKQILSFHKIRIPDFCTFYRKHKVWLPKRLTPPLIVKPLSDEASRGISQASVVDNEQFLIERVRFIHEKMNADAIVEEYIDGREMYLGALGSKKITVFPPIEMKFANVPEDEPRVATYKAKWDKEYRKKWGIKNVFTGRLAGDTEKRIKDICKRAYRALNIQGYARFDIRVSSDSRIYILEANANPGLAKDEDFGVAAEKAGIPYTKLIQKLLSHALKRGQRPFSKKFGNNI